MTPILVTGATGRVGSALGGEHLTDPVSPRLATRNPEVARERFGDGLEYAEFDLSRPETWGRALEAVDRVFLVLPPGLGVRRIYEFVYAAGRTGVGHVTFRSILGAERVPIQPHPQIERHLEGAGVTHTARRSAYFMQNLADIHCPEIVDRDEIFVPAGDGELGFVDDRDVGSVAAATLTERGHADRAHDLTGPAALDFYAVAETFSDVPDRTIRYANPTRSTSARRMYQRGVAASTILFMLAEYQVTRLGPSGRTTHTVERILDRPATPMAEFVADYRTAFEAS